MLSDADLQLRRAFERLRLNLTPVWRVNASRLLSLSRDGRRLYLNEALQAAPPEVLESAARFAAASLQGRRDRQAVETIRRWSRSGGRRGLAAVAARARRTRGAGRKGVRRRGAAVRGCGGTPAQAALLRSLYEVLCRDRFDDLLASPLPLVWSYRMTRTLGNCRMVRVAGERRVIDIGMNPSLLLAGNEAQLRDTLLHEMAHAAAWIVRGDGGHGPHWKAIAAAVGCDPRSRYRASPLLRRRAAERISRCPDVRTVLAAR